MFLQTRDMLEFMFLCVLRLKLYICGLAPVRVGKDHALAQHTWQETWLLNVPMSSHFSRLQNGMAIEDLLTSP